MTKSKQNNISQIKSFYNKLAPIYNEMIFFNRRFKNEIPIFKKLIEKFQIRTAIDAGCGTGFHSIILSKLGIKVWAIDISGKMLEQLKINSKNDNLNIITVKTSFDNINKVVKENVDSIFCLGNSLPHTISSNQLKKSIKNFYSILKPNGIIILQILNYDRILKKRQRIQSIKENRKYFFIRFYDYKSSIIRFNILTINKSKRKITHSIQSTLLRPITSKYIENLLLSTGFRDINFYANLKFDRFYRNISIDMIVFAKKPKQEKNEEI